MSQPPGKSGASIITELCLTGAVAAVRRDIINTLDAATDRCRVTASSPAGAACSTAAVGVYVIDHDGLYNADALREQV